MPLYEYQCESCGHRFEVIQKFSDAPLEACPKCGGAVRKLISSPAFHLKGTGWYATDYAKKSGAGASESKTEKSESTPSTKSGGDSKDASAGTSTKDSGSSSSGGDSTPSKS